ncbi:YycH family regulatory protein [Rossellomorea aquimaris]|nr:MULTISPECIES: two-component system activity regulator YycH [Bacillaceae]
MKYEQIKSITLTLLVVSSIFLTWSLWTYQPSLEPIDESNITEDIIIGDQKELNEVILPLKLLYHRSDKTYGTQRQFEMENMIEQMASWNVYELTNISGSLSNAEFMELVHGGDRAEIIFSDLISFEVFKNVLKFQDNQLPQDTFDRMVVKTRNDSEEFGTVYFVSYAKQRVYESRINNATVQSFERDFAAKSLKHPEYFGFDATDTRRIYLPENSVDLNSYQYVNDQDTLNQYVDALFSKPSLVSHEFTNNGEEFNDDSSLMRVNVHNKTFSFVNIEEEAEGEASVTNLITQTSDFINDHGGWPIDYSYRYFAVSKPQRKVLYRMFMHDLPVFSESGMAEYSVVLGKVNIYKYSRPYTSLDGVSTETSSVTLPSGRKVLDHLMGDNIKPEQIEEIVQGFKLANDVSNLVVLEPAWYYKYAGSWIRIQSEDVGRVPIGLE